jgi:hypothetical protein
MALRALSMGAEEIGLGVGVIAGLILALQQKL